MGYITNIFLNPVHLKVEYTRCITVWKGAMRKCDFGRLKKAKYPARDQFNSWPELLDVARD